MSRETGCPNGNICAAPCPGAGVYELQVDGHSAPLQTERFCPAGLTNTCALLGQLANRTGVRDLASNYSTTVTLTARPESPSTQPEQPVGTAPTNATGANGPEITWPQTVIVQPYTEVSVEAA